MSKFRPTYQNDRIGLELQRQRHAREAEPGCRCLFCLRSEEIEAIFRERIRLERLAGPEIDF